MGITEAQLASIKQRGIKGPNPGEKRVPFGVPNGWFAVAQSDDLKPGETKNAHYFGRDLVIWREHGTGTPHVVDAYCPHMGAHLGVGVGSPESHEPGPGIVTGGCLQCPFHAWRFDGTGRCVDIPYAETTRIPAKARVRAYPTIEKNGLISAWHHTLDEPPQWELPDVAEFDDDEWEGPIYTERYIDVALQVMMENDVDTPHFKYVHGTETIPRQEERFDGRVKFTAGTRADGRTLSREVHQIGFGLLRVTDVLVFIAASTPIDVDHTHQRWVFAYPKALGAEAGQGYVDAFAKSGIYQDIPIWEHMQYRERPLLVKGDGNVMAFRRWAEQFYTPTAPKATKRTSTGA
jgi:phenylpropionate dioxygenase-like ring-hydroxylating dioxygenase large terminal subunit